MRNTILSTLILIITLSGTVNADQLTRTDIISQLPSYTNEINKNLPMRIDKDTRLDSILAFGDVVTYIYTLVNLRASSVTQDMKDFLHEQAVNGYCTAMGDMKIFRDNNITLNINYRGIDGKFATVVSVNSLNCNK